jgi:hypothetical protein
MLHLQLCLHIYRYNTLFITIDDISFSINSLFFYSFSFSCSCASFRSTSNAIFSQWYQWHFTEEEKKSKNKFRNREENCGWKKDVSKAFPSYMFCYFILFYIILFLLVSSVSIDMLTLISRSSWLSWCCFVLDWLMWCIVLW